MTDKEQATELKERINTGAVDPDVGEGDIRALALAYAKYLKEHGLEPGETKQPEAEAAENTGMTEEAGAKDEAEATEAAVMPGKKEEKQPALTEELLRFSSDVKFSRNKQKKAKDNKKSADAEKKRKRKEKQAAKKDLPERESSVLGSLMDLHDSLQEKSDDFFIGVGRDFARGSHAIASTYRNSRRSIGIALFMIGVIAAGILVVFDRFTVYEYAYNGKILGYVDEQEEVTDVLSVAGSKLSQNNGGESNVEFVANQNVTFNLVDGRGKSTDDADAAVNKLIYMSDIETEAFGIYDGDKAVAIVKSQEDAEELLVRAMEELSKPDSGMELVSAEFTNPLDVRPINVLLGSVQSNQEALDQMVKGGDMETWHLTEEGETAADLAAMFGVEPLNIFNENNSDVAEELEQGDKVCIHSVVEPVSVKMVETGRMRETEEFETIKKDSADYYQGDSFVEQEGVNGIYIFEGTITKVGGEITDKDQKSRETIRETKDKIILVGTKERPKTAPTGTYQMPIQNYVVTSEWGGRWGRMHDGMDFGAPTGTPIYAADGGTVVRATYYSGYGLCVDIDHENGRMTRYGHCSRLLVSAGDKVYQGQEIALVGNTGHSFGSHLHFEVRIDGVSQNPRNYVNP